MEAIISIIIKSIFEYIQNWYTIEKSRENELKAKVSVQMLQSVKDVDIIENKIESAGNNVKLLTPSAWNKGLLICVTLATISGCTIPLFTETVYVDHKYPIITGIDRPEVAPTPEFTEREGILILYALKLESKIIAYNTYAHEQNIKNSYEDVPSFSTSVVQLSSSGL